jgi:hypothetical protein
VEFKEVLDLRDFKASRVSKALLEQLEQLAHRDQL